MKVEFTLGIEGRILTEFWDAWDWWAARVPESCMDFLVSRHWSVNLVTAPLFFEKGVRAKSVIHGDRVYMYLGTEWANMKHHGARVALVAHEIGHVLGLDHTWNPLSVMWKHCGRWSMLMPWERRRLERMHG